MTDWLTAFLAGLAPVSVVAGAVVAGVFQARTSERDQTHETETRRAEWERERATATRAQRRDLYLSVLKYCERFPDLLILHGHDPYQQIEAMAELGVEMELGASPRAAEAYRHWERHATRAANNLAEADPRAKVDMDDRIALAQPLFDAQPELAELRRCMRDDLDLLD